MAGPLRPQIVLFGSSIIQMSFDNGGWGAILANLYARKVLLQFSFSFMLILIHQLHILQPYFYMFLTPEQANH